MKIKSLIDGIFGINMGTRLSSTAGFLRDKTQNTSKLSEEEQNSSP